jgi:class 3 adenylate cyclase/CHASE2 domain-containing sensor protein
VRLWVFCFYRGSLKTTARHSAPLFITLSVLALVCVVYLIGEATKERGEGKFRLDIFDKLECITYDARVRMAAAIPDETVAGRTLATMFIDDEAIERVNDGMMSAAMAPAWDDGNLEGLEFSVPWPRFMYGQMVRELKAQGAKAIGFDIFFSELDRKSPDTSVTLNTTNVLTSDEFFAHEITEAGNVILATEGELLPKPLFAEGAAQIGNIASRNDYGVLRRVRAFGEYKVWHPEIAARIKPLNLKLKDAHVTTKPSLALVIPQISKGSSALDEKISTNDFIIPLHANGNLKVTKDGQLNLDDDAKDMGPDDQPPYTMKKAWNLGITLAAMQLGLDLDKAVVEPNRIILAGTNGVRRVIPTDNTHSFYIDWKLRWQDIKDHHTAVIAGSPLQILSYDFERQQHGTNYWRNIFTNRLVIFGSVATGNNLTDLGSTPIEEKTPLVTKHLNVANSILEDRFVQRTSATGTILLILVAGAIAGMMTWRSKVVHASVGTAVIAIVYVAAAFAIYVQTRHWIPIVMPVFGGLLVPHFCLVTYRVMFEQKEQRHLKSVFTKVVAPEVVNELLSKEKLSLGGARRELSVYFADVRGFTEFTDRAQKEAEAYVKKHNLSGKEAEAYYDEQAKETLATVNGYLSAIADQVKKHRGTLDKYIGDCVMAFWGAPVPQAQHALCAVQAAIDSQRAMYRLNVKRAQENDRRKVENIAREARGEELLPLQPVLQLGTGINTGMSTVGLMGSIEHIFNYTVFGVEVNLASRLEGVSGRGRIIVSYRTYEQVKAVDSALAATFIEQPAVTVKGISSAVRIFEVPWKEAEPVTAPAIASTSAQNLTSSPASVAAKV